MRLNFFNRDFFNAIQAKNGPEFWRMLIWVFTPWAFIYVGSAVVEYVVSSYLVIRWRRWLTRFYIAHWLEGHAHYRMSLTGGSGGQPRPAHRRRRRPLHRRRRRRRHLRLRRL